MGGALKSVFFGAVSGAVTFGIGDLFQVGSIVKAVGSSKFLVQGVAHGIAQGVLSVVQGGNFWTGAAAGFLGHLGAEGWGASMKGLGLNDFATSTMGAISFGALSGGVGAELTGGNFWQGAVTGGVVAGLNGTMHKNLANNIHRGYISNEFGLGAGENKLQGTAEVKYKYEYNAKTGKLYILRSHLSVTQVAGNIGSGSYSIGSSISQDGLPSVYKESGANFLIEMKAKIEIGIKLPTGSFTTQGNMNFQTKISFQLYYPNTNSYMATLSNRMNSKIYGITTTTQ